MDDPDQETRRKRLKSRVTALLALELFAKFQLWCDDKNTTQSATIRRMIEKLVQEEN